MGTDIEFVTRPWGSVGGEQGPALEHGVYRLTLVMPSHSTGIKDDHEGRLSALLDRERGFVHAKYEAENEKRNKLGSIPPPCNRRYEIEAYHLPEYPFYGEAEKLPRPTGLSYTVAFPSRHVYPVIHVSCASMGRYKAALDGTVHNSPLSQLVNGNILRLDSSRELTDMRVV